MKYFKRFFLLVLLFSTSLSCADDEFICSDLKDCPTLSNIEVISEEEKVKKALYYKVYCYENKTYTVLVCPICFIPVTPFAIDCAGNELCEIGDNSCLQLFLDEADYLYSFVQK